MVADVVVVLEVVVVVEDVVCELVVGCAGELVEVEVELPQAARISAAKAARATRLVTVEFRMPLIFAYRRRTSCPGGVRASPG